MKHLRTAFIGELISPHAIYFYYHGVQSHHLKLGQWEILLDLIIHSVIKSGSCFPNLYGKVFMTLFYYYLLSPRLSVVPTVLISYMHVSIIFTACAVSCRVAAGWQAPTQVELFTREASSGQAGWMRTHWTPQTRPSPSSSARSAAAIHMFVARQQTLTVLWLPLVKLKTLLLFLVWICSHLPNTLFHFYYLLKKRDLLYVETHLQPDVHLRRLVWVKRIYRSLMFQASSLPWIKIVCRLIWNSVNALF